MPLYCAADCAQRSFSIAVSLFNARAFIFRQVPKGQLESAGSMTWDCMVILWPVEGGARAGFYRRRSSGHVVSLTCMQVERIYARILVSSSRMACNESVSILSASEGMRVVASSAESGVRVPAACQWVCSLHM